MPKPENPPAFPFTEEGTTEFSGQRVQIVNPGMSLRDWFAGQALAGILADPQKTKEAERMSRAQDDDAYIVKLNAGLAYAYADAMLAERTKTDDR